jgi:hypothetical protein
MLWVSLGVIACSAGAVVMWRLDVQKQQIETDSKVVALLQDADKLIEDNRDDEAEAATRKALALLPGDVRGQAMVERLEVKRELIRKKQSTASGFLVMRAEQLEQEDLGAAVEAYEAIRVEPSASPEAKQLATGRIKVIKEGVCILLLPDDWPADAQLTIDDLSKNTAKKKIEGLVHGKRMIQITRPGYRAPAPMEVEFPTAAPVRLPAFQWKLTGAKVFVASTPSGAAVWRDGKDTGKVTPCDFEDIDEGPVEFVLKLSAFPDTPLKGEIKGRLPIKLSAKLEK